MTNITKNLGAYFQFFMYGGSETNKWPAMLTRWAKGTMHMGLQGVSQVRPDRLRLRPCAPIEFFQVPIPVWEMDPM